MGSENQKGEELMILQYRLVLAAFLAILTIRRYFFFKRQMAR